MGWGFGGHLLIPGESRGGSLEFWLREKKKKGNYFLIFWLLKLKVLVLS